MSHYERNGSAVISTGCSDVSLELAEGMQSWAASADCPTIQWRHNGVVMLIAIMSLGNGVLVVWWRIFG